MNIKSRSILTLLSSISFHLILGSYHMWTRISNYYISYLFYHDNPNITSDITILFIPSIRLIYTLNLPIGIYIASKLGWYSNIIISFSLVITSHCIIILSTNLYFIALAFVLFAIGIGIGYLPTIVNTWHYFPNKNGMILSIIWTAFSASPLILKIIGDMIINPRDEGINEITLLYTKEVAGNIIKFISLVTLIFIVLGVATLLLVRPWNNSMVANINSTAPKKVLVNAHYNNANGIGDEGDIYSKWYDYIENNPNDESNRVTEGETRFTPGGFFEESLGMSQRKSLSLALKSKPFIQWTCIFILSSMFNSWHISSSIAFGEREFYTYGFLQNTISVWSYSNCLFRLYWGRLWDFIHFKKVYTFSLFLQISIFSLFYFILQIKIAFVLFNLLSAMTTACTNIIIPYAFYKIFGYKNGGVLFGFCQFTAAMISFGVPKLISVLKENDLEYLILFLVNSWMTIWSWITLCFFIEKKFDYHQKANEEWIKTRYDTSITSSQSGASMQSW